MPLRYEVDGRIATFTIDNGRLSILTPQMHRELYEALQHFVADRAVHVGILTGSPGQSFCAGDDIKSTLPALTPEETLDAHLDGPVDGAPLARPGYERAILAMARYKPIVAAVDGYCLGQGFIYLAHLTDIRIASDRAEFGLPEIAYGMGGGGGMARLGAQIPHVRAMWMLMTGERFSAAQAEAWHLVNEVVPADRLQARAREIADTVARHPRIALRVEMEAYARALEMPREQAADYIGTLYRLQRMGYQGYGAGTGFFDRDDDDRSG